tara:strand:+ start:3925 stop:6963 length:3039 start_codon:yes stop_codon:yes gene_type:complete
MSIKTYALGTHTPAQYRELKNSLTSAANSKPTAKTLQEPSRQVEQKLDIKYSGTRGEFQLTDEEAASLRADPRIVYMHESYRVQTTTAEETSSWERTPEQIEETGPILDGTTATLKNRYDLPIKNYQRVFQSNYKINLTNTALQDFDFDGDTYTAQHGKDGLFIPNSSSFINLTGTSTNQATWQLKRPMHKINPWIESNTDFNEPITSRQKQKGAGEDVDVIIVDGGVWAGHTEFINTGVTNAVNPIDYIGGNALRDTNIYSGSGYSDILDIVLDGPYYLDPDFFNAKPSTRLTTRFDGTRVPVESVAQNWWGRGIPAGDLVSMNTDTGRRSSQFPFSASLGILQRLVNYKREAAYGSQKIPLHNNAQHGTPCAALAYGRTQGWAYNSNKWTINLHGKRALDAFGGSWQPSSQVIFADMIRIFHQFKPKNIKFGTKNPTLLSNSWSLKSSRFSPLSNNLAMNATSASHFRFQNIVSGGIDPSNQISIQNTFPRFALSTMFKYCVEFFPTEFTVASDEMLKEYTDTDGNVQPGPIFLCSANGNQHQHIFRPEDSNFDNRYSVSQESASSDDPYGDRFGYEAGQGILDILPSINRRGFPAHAGVNQYGNYALRTSHSMQDVKYPCITVGALDNELQTGSFSLANARYPISGAIPPFNGLKTRNPNSPKTPSYGNLGFYTTGSIGKERVAIYSGKGPGVDLYMPADATLAACCQDMTKTGFDILSPLRTSTLIPVSRSDSSYTGFATKSMDQHFDGTSAATPVATGWLATIMQYNRGWSYHDVRAYLTGSVGTQSGLHFYTGSVSDTPSSSNWVDQHSLQGGAPIVGYTADYIPTTPFPFVFIAEHNITSSLFTQSGSVAVFKNGININGSINSSHAITATKLIGDGSNLSIPGDTGFNLFIGSASIEEGIPVFAPWVTGSKTTNRDEPFRSHEILLSTSASSGIPNHYTFLKMTEGGYEEVSDYVGTQNGLVSVNSLTQTLGTGVHQYLLVAMSTASLRTEIAATTVIINPENI